MDSECLFLSDRMCCMNDFCLIEFLNTKVMSPPLLWRRMLSHNTTGPQGPLETHCIGQWGTNGTHVCVQIQINGVSYRCVIYVALTHLGNQAIDHIWFATGSGQCLLDAAFEAFVPGLHWLWILALKHQLQVLDNMSRVVVRYKGAPPCAYALRPIHQDSGQDRHIPQQPTKRRISCRLSIDFSSTLLCYTVLYCIELNSTVLHCTICRLQHHLTMWRLALCLLWLRSFVLRDSNFELCSVSAKRGTELVQVLEFTRLRDWPHTGCTTCAVCAQPTITSTL